MYAQERGVTVMQSDELNEPETTRQASATTDAEVTPEIEPGWLARVEEMNDWLNDLEVTSGRGLGAVDTAVLVALLWMAWLWLPRLAGTVGAIIYGYGLPGWRVSEPEHLLALTAPAIAVLIARIRGNLYLDGIRLPADPPNAFWAEALVDASGKNGRRAWIARRLLALLLRELREEDVRLIQQPVWDQLKDRLLRNRASDAEPNVGFLKALERRALVDDIALLEFAARRAALWRWQRTERLAARLSLSRVRRNLARRIAASANEAQRAEEGPVAGDATAESEAVAAKLNGDGRPAARRPRVSSVASAPIALLGNWIVDLLAKSRWLTRVVEPRIALLFGLLHRPILTGQHAEALREMVETGDIRMVGPVVEALAWPDSEVRRAAAEALIVLLPRLKASDSKLLNASQRASLYGMLRMSEARRRSDLIRAILKALEQVGDEEAVFYVDRLAHEPVFTPSQLEACKAAEECLPFLKASAARQKIGDELLRPAALEADSPDTLLRPAASAPDLDPETLLRPGQLAD
jgi:hypothetical protein